MWKSYCFILCLMLTGVSAAAPPGTSSLDDQLLDGLRRPAASAVKPPRVGEDLGEPRQDGPIAELAREMHAAGQRLRGRDTSVETSKLQSEIVRRLTEVIDQLEQQADGENSSASASATPGSQAAANPGNAAQANAVPNGTAPGSDAIDAANSVEKVWGLLPDRLRQQIQSPIHEEFLPQYDRVIREYYKRMAEEQGSLRRAR